MNIMNVSSAEEALEAVRKNGFALKFVPDGLKTLEVCSAAVQQNGTSLHWVPDAVKTEEMCLEAVRLDGAAFGDVPEALRTSAVRALAVENSRWTLPCMPADRKAEGEGE